MVMFRGWVPSPGVTAFIGFAVQAGLAQFESAGASALHTPFLFVLIQVTRRRADPLISIYLEKISVDLHCRTIIQLLESPLGREMVGHAPNSINVCTHLCVYKR